MIILGSHWWVSPSYINNHLCSYSTYNQNCKLYISFSYFSIQNTKSNFQGCHIYAILANQKLKGNPDQKLNFRFFIFMIKILQIYNLFFRVPKKGMSGLPYLLKPWFNFHVKCVKLMGVQPNIGHYIQISWARFPHF